MNLKSLELLQHGSEQRWKLSEQMLKRIRQVAWSLVAVVAAAFAYWSLKDGGRFDRSTSSSDDRFVAEFELVDHTGAPRTAEDYRGRWLLVFFGFANCPDICPTTLAEVAAAMNQLGPLSDEVQPLFVTIDPERDTPEALAEFIPQFEAGIVGLSGTPDQIAETARSFFVFSEKVDDQNAPDGYTMGHSSQLFLFAPDGGYERSWAYGTPVEDISSDLLELMRS